MINAVLYERTVAACASLDFGKGLGRLWLQCLTQVTMADEVAAQRACKDPNPIIDGRKANVNLAYLGAKPRLPVGDILCTCW